MPITKNIRDTISIATSSSSTFLTFITNPYTWIVLGILFFPLNLVNYIILFIVDFFIVMGNVLIFAGFLILFLIIALVVLGINALIGLFNGLSFTIPMPSPFDDIVIDLPNLPTFSMPPFPTFGVIPYLGIEDVRIFTTDKVLLLWILELIGVSFPF